MPASTTSSRRRLRCSLSVLAALTVLGSSVQAWETTAEAARQARSLLTDPTVFGVGTLSSIYPDDFRIPQLRGRIASGPEYFAPCWDNGDLALMALTVSQNWRNILPSFGGSGNATFTIAANPSPDVPDPRHSRPASSPTSSSSSHNNASSSSSAEATEDPSTGREWDPHRPQWRRGMPSKNRITLFGSVKELSHPSSSLSDDTSKEVSKCYLATHPDAKHWAPGAVDSPHSALWVRFKVEELYSIGGYGDEHKIAFLPLEEYQRAVDGVPSDGDSGGMRSSKDNGADVLGADVRVLFGESDEVKEGSTGSEPLLRFQYPARR